MEFRYRVLDLWAKMNLLKSDKIREVDLTIFDDGQIFFEAVDPKDPYCGINYEEVHPIDWSDPDEAAQPDRD